MCVLQRLDAVQRVEGSLCQTLDLVVVQRQKRQVLQVLEGSCPHTVDLVGVEQSEQSMMTQQEVSGARDRFCALWQWAETHSSSSDDRPSKTPAGSSEILLP